MRTVITFLACLFFSAIAFASVEATVSVENMTKTNDLLEFDLYLHTTAETDGDLFLGNADFVLSINNDLFESPQFSKVVPAQNAGFQKGHTQLVSSNLLNPNDITTQLNVQKAYFDATTTTIVDGMLVINLNGLSPADLSTLQEKVARIDGEASTHKLGRFSVSGLVGSIDDVRMTWRINTSGLSTKVFTLDPGSQISSPVVLTEGQIVEGWNEIVEEITQEVSGLQLAPNPTSSITQITYTSTEDRTARVNVIDVAGRQVLNQQWEITKGINTMDVSLRDMPAGVYQISVDGETAKLVKL